MTILIQRLCEEGEGDCDEDDQCSGAKTRNLSHVYEKNQSFIAGMLECGSNNCALKSGGLWDSEDDCCQKKCAPDRPCLHGQGPCNSSLDCVSGGSFHVCASSCLNRDIFPLAEHPTLAESYGFVLGTTK